MIRASIDEFGWTQSVIIDEKDKVWGGHGRRLAALVIDEDGKPLEYAAGETRPEPLAQIPVAIAADWSQKQKLAYMLAENRLPELSDWDEDLRREHLKSLDGIFDLRIAGFDAITLPQFLADPNEGRGDPDEFYIPTELPEEFVQVGDVWQLGAHRLICGDATSAEIVGKVLQGEKPKLLVSDPPYGVNYDPKWRDRVKRSDGSKVRAKAVGLVQNDTRDDWREAWALFPGDVAYVWHGGLHSSVVQASLEAVNFAMRAQIIWAKLQFVVGRGDYHWQHECCWYAVRRGKSGRWNGDRKQSTVWRIAAPSGWAQIKEGQDAHTGIHSTQKMVECMKRPIENNSKLGDAVYEPFNGSGTTIIACEVTGRRCFAVELIPAYVQVAITRWEKFSGKVATLNGKTMAEVASARGKPLPPSPRETSDAPSDSGKPVRRPRKVAAGAVAEQAGK